MSHELRAISVRQKARIQDADDSPILSCSDQASKSLLEPNLGLRHAELVEPIAACLLDCVCACSCDRGIGDCKRQPVDNYAGERLALHVYTLPERLRPEQTSIAG